MTTWADVLTQVMDQHRWTQADLARRAGMSANTVSNIMRGLTAPSPRSLERLAEAAGLPVGELYRRHSHDLDAAEPLPEVAPPRKDSDSGVYPRAQGEAMPPHYLQQLQHLLDMMPEDARQTIVADAKRRALQWLMDDEVRPSHGAVG
jgi:transcriptional regulator with XRE-family HTH domain